MIQIRNNCKLCGKKGQYNCSKCGQVAYCSRECQFKDWVNHKNNCINFNNKNSNQSKKSPISLNKKVIFSKDIISNNNNNVNKKKEGKPNRSRNISNDLYDKKKKNKTNYSSLYPNNEKNNKIKNKNVSSTATNDSGTMNTENPLKETQITNEDKNIIPVFDFMLSLKEIIFKKKKKNIIEEEKDCEEEEEEEGEITEENINNNLMNEKINLIYNLLKSNRKYIIEKVLIEPGKEYIFTKNSTFRDKFIDIEKYIFNYIFLIKFLYIQGDPVSLIKANQALNYLAKEMLDYKNNGLLVYSLNIILRSCLMVIKQNIFQNVNFCYEIVKKYLFLLSCLIKLSKQLEIPRLYHKFIDHYSKIYDLALDLITSNHTNHTTEKAILKSNLLFNVGGLFVQKNMLNSSIKLYKEVINIQSHLEPYSFVYGASYYNICILYYVMGNIKNCDVYLNELFKEIDKYDETFKAKKYEEDFRRFKCKLLLFSAELNMEKENYLKAINNLKEIINKLEKTSIKERHKTQQTLADKKYNNMFAKNMKKNNHKSVHGKSNSIVSNMLLGFSKEKILKPKKKKEEKSYIEYLYEIDFYDNTIDKIHFNEKIKEIVNGLLEAILFIQREKEIKLKEKQSIEKKLNKKLRKNNSEKNFKRLKSSSVVYETEGNLIDIEPKNLIGRVRRNENNYYSYSNERKKNRSTSINFLKKENNLKEKSEKIKNESNNEEKYYNEEKELRFIPEKTAQKVLSYFNEEIVKKVKIINNEGDITDFKYFFILLTNLSFRQVEILNNTQNVNIPPILFKNLPIFFSRQFKNTLNPAQRNIFDKLRVLSLIRSKVLADSNKKISVDNINFNIFHANLKFNDIKLKQYSDISKKIREVISSGYDVFYQRNSGKLNSTLKSSQLEISQDSQNNLSNNQIDTNACIKKYITKKSKQFQKCENNSNTSNYSDNEDNEESIEEEASENIDFKYSKKFNLKEFKNKLIEEINNSYMMYSNDEIDNMILLVQSPIFVEMMNSIEFEDIKELENDLPLMIELLKKEIKNIEKIQIEHFNKREKQFESSSSSYNEIDIKIDEKDLEKKKFGLKHKYSADFSSLKIFQNKLKEINITKKTGQNKGNDRKINKFNVKNDDNMNNFHNILRTSTNVGIQNKKDLNN